jgi:translation initiation factor 3 subunit B
MAPSYDQLPTEDGFEDEEDEIDFTDLDEQRNVRTEEGYDTFVVCDNIPVVPEDSKGKLVKFLLRKLTTVGKIDESAVHMPVVDGMSQGYAFVEYATPEQAIQAVKQLHGTALDKRHTMAVNKLTDVERYGREGRINEEYSAPEIEDFKEKEHLKWWLGDEEGRDQFIMSHTDNVGVFWNQKDDQPENIVDRKHWTETFTAWSPLGVYLASMHMQGVQLWGGPSWSRLKRFPHPGVNLVDFSPNENYITTWSHKPIQVEEGNPILTPDEEGKNYIIWDITTGKPLRSFANIEEEPRMDDMGNQVKKKLQWPAFKWSSDDKYVARLNPGQSLSVYELPRMNLLDKVTIKIEGVVDFEWAPSSAIRDGFKGYEQLLCFWTPELGSNPAKVGLMSIPSKEIVRTRNLFNGSDAKLHWQSQSKYVCVKVDRHSKSKKSLATNLEIFRIREKGVPVEVIDTINATVINFAWEPAGDRFVIITASDGPATTGPAVPKTAFSFYCPEKAKGNTPGNFKHIRTIDKRNSNGIYWSPKGRFVVVATVLSAQSSELDFYDCDFEGEKDEKDKDLMANLQIMATGDHYGMTDIEWDPTGRYLASSASMWKNAVSILSFADEQY